MIQKPSQIHPTVGITPYFIFFIYLFIYLFGQERVYSSKWKLLHDTLLQGFRQDSKLTHTSDSQSVFKMTSLSA